ncbi:MAG: histidine kinase [Polyangiaceae bacterium]
MTDPSPQSRQTPEAGDGGENSSLALVADTWRALLAPRRLAAILVVIVPILYLQSRFSRDERALILGALLCTAFVAVAPASWRVLFPIDRDLPSPALRAIAYGAIGVIAVSGIGLVIPKVFHIPATFLTYRPSLIVSVALFWVGGWGLARDVDMEEQVLRAEARSLALAREAEHAQLLALKSHLDPHFLFNTLNAIAEWCRSDPEVAEKAVLELAGVLRTVMEGIKHETWSLSREVELVKAVFALHAIRDPDRFRAICELESPLPAIEVPSMVLLPLAENAMKHGPSAGHRGDVRLTVHREGESVRIVIENPGKYQGPRVGGEGLGIVEKRLRLTYGDRAAFEMSSRQRSDSVGPSTARDVTLATLNLPVNR